MTKSYSELIKLKTYEERFEYLKLNGRVGEDTFGYDRYLNQALYTSNEWRKFRNKIIIRDHGCDLGISDREIFGPITIHHINPITREDVLNRSSKIFDPENVISTSDLTHKAIHYSNEDILIKNPVERTINDTCPWKK